MIFRVEKNQGHKSGYLILRSGLRNTLLAVGQPLAQRRNGDLVLPGVDLADLVISAGHHCDAHQAITDTGGGLDNVGCHKIARHLALVEVLPGVGPTPAPDYNLN